jgi:membrane protein DedA with SNARE-associated domain
MPEGDEAPATAAPERTEAEKRQRRRRLTILLTPIAAFSIAGFIVGILAPTLINDHPLVVIFFQPINRWLILASNRVETWEFFAVAFFRLTLTDPLYFMLGHWFGDGALDWIENKTGNSGAIPFIKKWFAKAGPVIVFLAPNAYVCVLAGAAGMKVRLFVALNVVGTIGRLILIKATGDVFEPVLEPILDFIKRYQWQLVAVSLTIFAIQTATNRRKGKKGDLQSITAMEAELEASIDAADKE